MIISLRSQDMADIVYDVPELQTNYFKNVPTELR